MQNPETQTPNSTSPAPAGVAGAIVTTAGKEAEKSTTVAAKKAAPRKVKVKPSAAPVGLEAILGELDAQDQKLKSLKDGIQDVLGGNQVLRKAIKQAVKDASRQKELENQIAGYKKKLSTLKGLLS